MRLTDDGEWREVPEATYRAYLANHPRKAALRGMHEKITKGDWWFIYDAEAFETSGVHNKYESRFKVAYRVRETGREMRFWIPANEG
jgi:hypothetical protein